MTDMLSDREKLVSVKMVFYESFLWKKIEKISKDISELPDVIIEEINSKSGDIK